MDGAQAFQNWREQMMHVRRLSPKTVEAYTHDVGGFLAFLREHRGESIDLPALKDVSAADVRGWLATRREDGLGPRGVARAVSALRKTLPSLTNGLPWRLPRAIGTLAANATMLPLTWTPRRWRLPRKPSKALWPRRSRQ